MMRLLIATQGDNKLFYTGLRVLDAGTPNEQRMPTGEVHTEDGEVILVNNVFSVLSRGYWETLPEVDSVEYQ